MTRGRMIEYQQRRDGRPSDIGSVVLQPVNAYEMDDEEPIGNPEHHYVGDLDEVTRPGNTGLALGALGLFSWFISGRILKRKSRQEDPKNVENEST